MMWVAQRYTFSRALLASSLMMHLPNVWPRRRRLATIRLPLTRRLIRLKELVVFSKSTVLESSIAIHSIATIFTSVLKTSKAKRPFSFSLVTTDWSSMKRLEDASCQVKPHHVPPMITFSVHLPCSSNWNRKLISHRWQRRPERSFDRERRLRAPVSWNRLSVYPIRRWEAPLNGKWATTMAVNLTEKLDSAGLLRQRRLKRWHRANSDRDSLILEISGPELHQDLKLFSDSTNKNSLLFFNLQSVWKCLIDHSCILSN